MYILELTNYIVLVLGKAKIVMYLIIIRTRVIHIFSKVIAKNTTVWYTLNILKKRKQHDSLF